MKTRLRSVRPAAVAALSAVAVVLVAGPPVAAAATPTPTPTAQVEYVTPAHVPYYVVPATDQVFLYQLAQQLLGDGNQYSKIFDLNKGRRQPNGDRLTDPTLIETGWYLVLPCAAKGSDYGVSVRWNPPPDLVPPTSVAGLENCAGIGPSPVPRKVTPAGGGATKGTNAGGRTSTGSGTGKGAGTGAGTGGAATTARADSASRSRAANSGVSPAGLAVGGGAIVLIIVAALAWSRLGRRRAPVDGTPPPAPAGVGREGAREPASQAASPRTVPAPVAVDAAVDAPVRAAVSAQGGAFRRAPRITGTVGARLRRRKDPTPAQLLLADPNVPALGARALELAGRGAHWWPYAALVGTEEIEVRIAGLDVPQPRRPWTAGTDQRTWILRRSELEARAESAEPAEFTEPAELTEPTGDAAEVCPAVLGVRGEAVVVMDVARSHGTLLFSGDPVQAERVRSALAEQLEGGEMLAGAAPPYPHWELPVDARGTVLLHGLPVVFTPLPDTATPRSAQPQASVPPPTRSGTPTPTPAPTPTPTPTPMPAPASGPERVPAPAGQVPPPQQPQAQPQQPHLSVPPPQEPDEWDDIAISSA
ncbi:hypothetical protein KGA66_00745 [Actinocrinis puniceicyclus]|uniref:Uncharacterized protein n=1 Tax=Actinocrinis puniceicyclus TaxID=977794 RepID=A0A8J8B9Z5_9ACTN|nr:hypothetical protein [Actinocrinis puniceicyclus]MBS2961553.1 hypothetical protein [Actinocrinis puniceicyclus]